MLNRSTIMIVEDDVHFAEQLSDVVAVFRGRVAGHARTVGEAFTLIGERGIDAAVVNADLDDALLPELVAYLDRESHPFVLHTAAVCATPVTSMVPDRQPLRRPVDRETELFVLLNEMSRRS